MRIEGVNIILNRSSGFVIEAPDKVINCLIYVQKSDLGVDHPIVIRSGASFGSNSIVSEIPEPIWLDKDSGDDFSGVGNNIFRKKNGA
jgi:hypothetical protein